MNGDRDNKEGFQLQVEYGDFGSAQTATLNSQTCESQFVERPRRSMAARLFGIGIVSLLLFVVFTHPRFNIVRNVPDYYEVGIFLGHLNEPGYPDPSDGAVVGCISSAEWDEYYELPSWAQLVPFWQRYGTVTVEQSTEVSDDVITSKSPLPGQDNQLMFDVTLTLPASASEDALYIKSLETSAPLFSHKVAALSDTVFFGSISLNTLHFPINVQSVAAEIGVFTTANGLIKGHFHSTSSLKLITTNMGIDADVDLFHNESAKPSELVITTANAPLDARVSLTTVSGYAGEFGVDAQTANAPLKLTYTNSPVHSQLNSKARTVNAPVTVGLHSAFEGSFSISSFIGPSLEQHTVEDPTGKGRERHVTAFRSRGHIQGSVRWVGGEHSGGGTGFVQVSTTLSPAKLIL
ncbi:hypothetical protein F4604DRAFT_1679698 [Suillus subluteus]|nr:hypothetical protein F4604DRAFT_1679698 [Suillus subluteus]